MPHAMDHRHINAKRTDQHTVRCSPRNGDPDEWVTIEYAIDRLSGYYRDDPEGWLEATLKAGTPLRTISFIYRIDQ